MRASRTRWPLAAVPLVAVLAVLAAGLAPKAATPSLTSPGAVALASGSSATPGSSSGATVSDGSRSPERSVAGVADTSGPTGGSGTPAPTTQPTGRGSPSPTPGPTPAPTPRPTPVPTATLPPSWQPAFPIRAAFYYPWFPEAWNQLGIDPYTNYHPTLGFYSTISVINAHITAMRYAGFTAGIASWWGQGSKTDGRMDALLSAASGVHFRWAIYYEQESTGDPTTAQISADLAYIQNQYASSPGYLKVNGRFVVFVYASGTDGCGMVDRWAQGNAVNAYVVLKVFGGYKSCASQPDGWHQYGPAAAIDGQPGYSYTISPGFWKAGTTPGIAPYLVRDPVRWVSNITSMVDSHAPWQLVTTFNEWGEGTSVESADEWSSPSGYGTYIDALRGALVGP
jgi:hypothetical protein